MWRGVEPQTLLSPMATASILFVRGRNRRVEKVATVTDAAANLSSHTRRAVYTTLTINAIFATHPFARCTVPVELCRAVGRSILDDENRTNDDIETHNRDECVSAYQTTVFRARVIVRIPQARCIHTRTHIASRAHDFPNRRVKKKRINK